MFFDHKIWQNAFPDPAGGAYELRRSLDPLVGWGGDTPPQTHPDQRLRRFDSRAFAARYSAPLAPRISRLRRSILAFPLLLIYEMITDLDPMTFDILALANHSKDYLFVQN